MLLANPFKFPTIEDVGKGIAHVLYTCRHEGLKYFRGPPPVLKIVKTGIQDEGNFYEADFLKQLLLKISDAKKSLRLDVSFQNLRVRTTQSACW